MCVEEIRMCRIGVLIIVFVSVAPGALRATTPPSEACRPEIEPTADGSRWLRARLGMLLPSVYARFDHGFPIARNRRLPGGTSHPSPGRLVLATSRTVTWEIGLRWNLQPPHSPREADDSTPSKRSEALERFCAEFAAVEASQSAAAADQLRTILNEEAARQKIDALRNTDVELSAEESP